MNNINVKKSVLITSVISSFLTAFLGSSVTVALPAIQRHFKIDAVTLAWITSSYLLATATFLLPFGRLSDIIGRKKTFLIGLILFTFFSFLCSFSPNIYTLIVLRVFQGLGSAMIFSSSTAIISSVFLTGERGKAMGLSVSAVYLGLTAGPLLGGILTHNFGWQSIFLLNFPIGVFLGIFVSKNLKNKEWADSKGEKFDWGGSFLYIIYLSTFMIGLTKIQNLQGSVYLAISIVFIAFFLFVESKVSHPILPFKLFTKNTTFTFSNIAALINYSATFAVSFLLSLYLQYIKGLTPQTTGAVLAIQPIIQAIFSSLAGKLSDKFEPRYVASFGMILTSLGLFLLSFINFNTTIGFVVIAQTCLGLGFAFFSSPNTNAIMSSVESKYYGIASAIVGTMRLVGQTLSIGVVTMFFAIYLGGTKFGAHLYPQFLELSKSLLLGFSIVCGIGVVASIARGKIWKEL
ncbi:MAG: MFS transporter [Candidatus Kapaibacteriota bacterium]